MVTWAIISGLAFRPRAARSRLMVIGVAACLSGCSTEVIGVVPLFDSLNVVSWVSTAVSGKSLSEYVLDALTGKDARRPRTTTSEASRGSGAATRKRPANSRPGLPRTRRRRNF